jgi:phosphohistidine phosphatase
MLAPPGGNNAAMGTTTRRLVLLRHAKSAWPDVADHERPLAGRGRRDAPAVGRWLRAAGYVPDLVLCSTARRASQTWQLVAPELGAAPIVRFRPGLYQAAADGLLTVIHETPDEIATLLLVGHEPAVRDLSLALADGQPDDAADGAMERLRTKYPTAAVAVLEFAGAWSRLGPGLAMLTDFAVPADMRA